MADPPPTEAVLDVEGLSTYFFTSGGLIKAVDDLSLSVGRGETVAIVGESGCGKSVTALSIMRLVPYPPGRIVSGRIGFGGRDLLALGEDEMRAVRGNRISMVFQEPMTSLNPVKTVGSQIGEVLRLHQAVGRADVRARVVEMLHLVQIPEPERRAGEYPHQLSGGMRQRVMIAMALACRPELLIADEPTTALDVTIQAQILSLIVDLQRSLGTALLLITHDLGVVAETADRVIVMYAGRKVEEAPVAALFSAPLHPYTRGLIGSLPRLSTAGGASASRFDRLTEIAGSVPSLAKMPPGCAFAPRCALADGRCRAEAPPLVQHAKGRFAACWRSG